MDEQNVKIRLVKTWSEDEIVALYKAGGWWKESYDKSLIKDMITGSYAFAVAVESPSGKAVGMGRLISDGISDAYIQDLVVLPEYRDTGIGRQLVDTLLQKCLSRGIQWVGLISEPGKENFFSEIGFRPMKNHIPMIYQIEE